jgi:Arc/MetJ-type ribon-helix-helix transcriptional regulator
MLKPSYNSVTVGLRRPEGIECGDAFQFFGRPLLIFLLILFLISSPARVRIRSKITIKKENPPVYRPKFRRLDIHAIKWQASDMASKLKTVHVTLTPQIATLLDCEVAAGRFANISEALRSAAWRAFAEDPSAELQAVFAGMDATGEKQAPDETAICAEIRAHRKGR